MHDFKIRQTKYLPQGATMGTEYFRQKPKRQQEESQEVEYRAPPSEAGTPGRPKSAQTPLSVSATSGLGEGLLKYTLPSSSELRSTLYCCDGVTVPTISNTL
jgi:hypothetical protein